MNHHPLHTNVWFAEHETVQGRNVVVGNLVYSLVLGMSVPDVSGAAIANLEVETLQHKFPTFHGDTIYAETRVLDVAASRRKADRGIVTVETKGVQPGRRGGLLLPPPGDGVEARRSRRRAPRPYDDDVWPPDGVTDPGASASPAAAAAFDRAAARVRAGPAGVPARRRSTWWAVARRSAAGRRVLDLAAGTGKLTRAAGRRGVRRGRGRAGGGHARRSSPTGARRARSLDGTAEAIPLADASVDAVVVGAGVPLVRRAGGAGRDRPGAAARRRARAWCGTTRLTSASTGCARCTDRVTASIGGAAASRPTATVDWPRPSVADVRRCSGRWQSVRVPVDPAGRRRRRRVDSLAVAQLRVAMDEPTRRACSTRSARARSRHHPRHGPGRDDVRRSRHHTAVVLVPAVT